LELFDEKQKIRKKDSGTTTKELHQEYVESKFFWHPKRFFKMLNFFFLRE
jgi:hypothetical protein